MNKKVIDNLVRARRIKLPTKAIEIAEDLKWNAKKINAELLQSIQKGESIPKLAKRLQTVTDMNKKAAIRNARTMVTSAENVGRLNSIKDLQKQGIPVMKKWISTMDSRTRDTHAALNGETIPENKKFDNGLMYPGDYNGAPSEVMNCRCSLGYVLEDEE